MTGDINQHTANSWRQLKRDLLRSHGYEAAAHFLFWAALDMALKSQREGKKQEAA